MKQNGRRRKCNWRHASRNVDIFRRLSPPLMGYWVWRWRLTLKGYPSTSQKSGSNPILGRVDISKVGLPSLWCGPHTSASGGLGCRHIISSFSSRSGRTARGPTCSDRRSGKTPHPAQLPPRTTPQIYIGYDGLIQHRNYKESNSKHLV